MLVCRLRRCSDGEEGTRGWHWKLLDCLHSCPWHSLAPLFAGIGKGQRVARRAEATRPQGCAVAREAARLRYREATMRHACSAGPQGCEAAALQAVSMRGCGAASSRGRADRAHVLRAHKAAGLQLQGSSSARPQVRGRKYEGDVHAHGRMCHCIHTENRDALVNSSGLRAFVVKNVPAALRRRR